MLSEELKVVRLEGSSTGRFPRPHLALGAEHLITYHFLTEGRAYALLLTGQRVELTAGDIVIFPHGDAHPLGNGLTDKPVDGPAHPVFRARG